MVVRTHKAREPFNIMLEIINAMRRRNQSPTHHLLDRVSMTLKAGLFDIDYNLHVNNANYLKFMEKGRVEHALATGLFKPMFSNRCRLLVASTEITYIREVRPYQPFTLHSRLIGWDGKYLYYDQRIEKDAALHTHALVRMAVVRESGLLTPQAFVELADLDVRSPALPEYIATWKQLLNEKKRYS